MPTIKFGSQEFECEEFKISFPISVIESLSPMDPVEATFKAEFCDIKRLMSRDLFVDGRLAGSFFVTEINCDSIHGEFKPAEGFKLD